MINKEIRYLAIAFLLLITMGLFSSCQKKDTVRDTAYKTDKNEEKTDQDHKKVKEEKTDKNDTNVQDNQIIPDKETSKKNENKNTKNISKQAKKSKEHKELNETKEPKEKPLQKDNEDLEIKEDNKLEANKGKKIDTKKVEVKKPGKKTQIKVNKEKDIYEYKTSSSTSSVPFKIIDNYSSSGGKTKVIRNGVQGTKLTTYKITYKNGIETKKETISTKVTKEPVDKIIARYVKVQDEKYENKKVDDRSKPIYEYTYKERWFVETIDNKKPYIYKYFYSSKEAFEVYAYPKGEYIDRQTRWGTAEDEEIKTLVGYEQKTIKEKIQDEKWDWKY